MSEIIFARTRHVYDSYQDFWKLVELSGFPTCYLDEIDVSSYNVYIFSPWNGEVSENFQRGHRPRARIVWWNGERPDVPGVPAPAAQMDKALDYVTDVWTTDGYMSALDSRMQKVIIGSDARLAGEPVERPRLYDYDYAHMSYIHGRRVQIHESLRSAGLREAPAAWGTYRNSLLRVTHLMLSTHQTPAPMGEGLRYALAAAYRMPLVCEPLADPLPMVRGVHYLGATASELPSELKWLREQGRALDQYGNALHELLCVEHTFRKVVLAGVEALRSRQ